MPCFSCSFRCTAFLEANPIVREPVMKVECEAPSEFQGAVAGQLAQRKGVVTNSETMGGYVRLVADVPLNQIFGYSTDLRSATQGKGEFSMELLEFRPVDGQTQKELQEQFAKERSAES